MTIEELKKVPFRETCHMAMEGEYTTTYMSKDGRLGFCTYAAKQGNTLCNLLLRLSNTGKNATKTDFGT